jgi:hypothetical protein
MSCSKIQKKIEKLERFPTYFCKEKKLRQKLVKIATTTKPEMILNRPVWIVKHSLIKDKLAIRPFGLIFVSKKIPKKLLDVIVKHEIIEEKWECISRRKAHKKAIKAELEFAKRKGKLKKLLSFLKKRYPKLYSERIKKCGIEK